MSQSRKLAASAAFAVTLALTVSGCGSGSSTDAPAASGALNQRLHDLLPQQVQDSGVLKVATDPEYPPCDFTNTAGQVDGFNHDLLMAMAPILGVKIEQPSISFDGLLPGVQSGRFDAAMECITDNAERQQTVKFVDYAYATLSNMTVAANPKNITENPLSLCGLHAGVQTGTEFVGDVQRFSQNCVQSGKPAIETTNFPSASTQNTALQSGRIDFAVTDTATGEYQNKQSNNAFKIISSPMLARTYVGITVAHDADNTAQALLGALQEIIKNGDYDKVMTDKWHLGDIGLKSPGINLAATRPIKIPEMCGACGLS